MTAKKSDAAMVFWLGLGLFAGGVAWGCSIWPIIGPLAMMAMGLALAMLAVMAS